MKSIQAIILATTFLLLPLGAAAQSRNRRASTADFERALGGLRPGTELVIQDREGNWTRGKLLAVYPDMLTVNRHKRTIDIQRDDIELVWRLTGRRTNKGMEVGALVGAIVGAVALAGVCHDEGPDKGTCLYAAIPGGGVFGAGAGYVIGAVVGSTMRRKRVVYYNRDDEYPVSPNPADDEDPFARARRQPLNQLQVPELTRWQGNSPRCNENSAGREAQFPLPGKIPVLRSEIDFANGGSPESGTVLLSYQADPGAPYSILARPCTLAAEAR